MEENIIVQEKINKFLSSEGIETKVYLIMKVEEQKKSIYSTCTFDLVDRENTFLHSYKGKIGKILTELNIVDFDPSVSVDGCIEKIPSIEVPNLSTVKQQLNPLTAPKITEVGIQLSDIWGVVCVFKNKEDKTVKIFRKYIHSKVSKESKMLRLIDGTLELLTDEILMFDLKIDAIEFDDTTYIINKFYFRQLFAFNEAYVEFVKKSLDKLKAEDVIINFDEFAEKGLDSQRVVNRFITVIKEDRLKWLKDNINSARTVAEEFKLKIKFEGDRILYTKKDCSVSDIMILICGLCVRDAVDMRKYIAAATKEVKDV